MLSRKGGQVIFIAVEQKVIYSWKYCYYL